MGYIFFEVLYRAHKTFCTGVQNLMWGGGTGYQCTYNFKRTPICHKLTKYYILIPLIPVLRYREYLIVDLTSADRRHIIIL